MNSIQGVDVTNTMLVHIANKSNLFQRHNIYIDKFMILVFPYWYSNARISTIPDFARTAQWTCESSGFVSHRNGMTHFFASEVFFAIDNSLMFKQNTVQL